MSAIVLISRRQGVNVSHCSYKQKAVLMSAIVLISRRQQLTGC